MSSRKAVNIKFLCLWFGQTALYHNLPLYPIYWLSHSIQKLLQNGRCDCTIQVYGYFVVS